MIRAWPLLSIVFIKCVVFSRFFSAGLLDTSCSIYKPNGLVLEARALVSPPHTNNNNKLYLM
jgi:hypothetical protein